MDHPWRYSLLIWAGWLAFCLFIQAGPRSVGHSLLTGVQGSTAALLLVTSRILPAPSRVAAASSSPDDQSPQQLQLQAENRELMRRVAELEEEVAQLRQAAPISLSERQSLLQVTGLPTRVIGQRGDQLNENLQLLISLGAEQGLHPSELVLAGSGILIDAGRDGGINSDQLLTSGRALFGRTREIGRRTSLVQPITDEQFRMAVRIVRRGRYGIVWGPQGVLVGTGSGCRLEEVSATEAVATGDEVFTDETVSPAGTPIYCGRVLAVDAAPGDMHWKITVAPLHTPRHLPGELLVLKSTLARAPSQNPAEPDRE